MPSLAEHKAFLSRDVQGTLLRMLTKQPAHISPSFSLLQLLPLTYPPPSPRRTTEPTLGYALLVYLLCLQLLGHLQEYQQVMREVLKVVGMLMLYGSGSGTHFIMRMAGINYATGQQESPPSNHYLQAVRRLHLTPRQVQHFQLMRKQFDRMARAQNQAGHQLLGLSSNSFNPQAAAVSGMSGSLAQHGSSSGEGHDGDSSGSGEGLQQQLGSSPGLLSSLLSGGSSLGALGVTEQEDAGLEDLLLQHVHNHIDMLVVSWLLPWFHRARTA